MELFFLRHFESTKNVCGTFSSYEDMEVITSNGRIHGEKVATDLRKIVKMLNLHVNNIYCADSMRAVQSANLIAAAFQHEVQVRPFRELISIKSDELLGKTKSEVAEINPCFIQELNLFDAGLFNLYNWCNCWSYNYK